MRQWKRLRQAGDGGRTGSKRWGAIFSGQDKGLADGQSSRFSQSDFGDCAVGIGLLRGIADAKIPMFITFVAYWIVGLPVAYMLGFTFEYGVEGIWIGLSLALTASAVMLTTRFYHRSNQPVEI